MRISRNLWLVCWTSLPNDISSEMVYPLIAFFLTGSLGASAVVVGVVEGVAESLAAHCLSRPGQSLWPLFTLSGVYGVQRALTDGVAKALVADLCPPHAKATALGLLDTLAGIGVLLASVIAGLLWDTLGAASMLWFGAACGLIAAGGLALLPGPEQERRADPG